MVAVVELSYDGRGAGHDGAQRPRGRGAAGAEDAATTACRATVLEAVDEESALECVVADVRHAYPEAQRVALAQVVRLASSESDLASVHESRELV